MPSMKLKPADGLLVRDPETGRALPEEGDSVPDTAYWRRRLRDGDCVPVAPAKKTKAKGDKTK